MTSTKINLVRFKNLNPWPHKHPNIPLNFRRATEQDYTIYLSDKTEILLQYSKMLERNSSLLPDLSSSNMKTNESSL